MLRIRLSRRGVKRSPHYRLVVTDKASPRDGRFVEIVGHYSPTRAPVLLKLDLERVDYWVGKGAQPSRTVRDLIRKFREESRPAPEKVAAPAPEEVEAPAPEKVET